MTAAPQEHVRPEHQRGADQAGEGYVRPRPDERPVPARERTHEGGRAQPDEPDRPGERHRRSGEQRGEHDDGDAGSPDRDTEPARGVVPQREGIETAGQEQEPDEAEQGEGRQLRDSVGPVLADAAVVPLVEALCALGEEQEQCIGDGADAQREGASGEDEPDTPRTGTGQPEHDGCRQEPSGERDTGGGEEGDRRSGGGEQSEGQVGAGVHREGVRRGEHIAADGLQGRARRAETDADQDSRARPRQARGEDDGRVTRAGVAGERLPHLGRADGGRALCEVDDGEDRDQEHERGRHRDGARRGPGRRGAGG